jgi:HSP20 family molecular chaperone IbpA
MPGVKKENLDITLDKGLLVVKGHRDGLRPKKYERKYKLTEYTDVDKISATLEDGLLTVVVPTKGKEVTARKVLIS